ncbi:hypothetical protein BHM03_00037104 [Ensete ventricosum]|nr:hypothetical protein BHM03_00037104 [Ensete ventricosum]
MPPPSALPFSSSCFSSSIASSSLRASLPRPNHALRPPIKLPPFQRQPSHEKKIPSSPPPPTPAPWLLPDNAESLKMPTAPWMTSPLLLPSDQVLDLSNPRRSTRNKKDPGSADRSLTDKVRGGRSRDAMLGIIRNIKNLRQVHSAEPDEETPAAAVADAGQAAEFGLPLRPAKGGRGQRAPWVTAEAKLVFGREKKVKVVTLAESVLAPELLFRLRGEARRMTRWVKAKKAGVTQGVVEEIRRGWKENELVMVRIVEPLRRNMDRAREIVEVTGAIIFQSCSHNLNVREISIHSRLFGRPGKTFSLLSFLIWYICGMKDWFTFKTLKT